MKKIFGMFVLACAALLTGCGAKVEVGPGEIGKVMTKNGYQDGIITTSAFRLSPCMSYCDRLVKLDVSDRTSKEGISVLMPQDKLIMGVGVQTTLTVDPKKSEALFSTLPPTAVPDSKVASVIAWKTVYDTYAKQIIHAETREFLSKYTIEHVASNMETINAELRAHLTKQIQARTPFLVRYVGIVDVSYPKLIVEAQEQAAKRREMIQQEEAQLEVSKVQLKRELQEAQLQRQIETEKAETEAVAQRLQNQTITPLVLELRKVEVEKLKWEKWNGQLPSTVAGDATKVLLK